MIDPDLVFGVCTYTTVAFLGLFPCLIISLSAPALRWNRPKKHSLPSRLRAWWWASQHALTDDQVDAVLKRSR